uniref:Succinate dehydrogenase cytochrome b556 subunit n=1 Tax=Candidatus Aschnera chinzeii TaxID=1485666 RepID=A0AAT9G3Z4_9ENTR|nr:MAG: succinate dehydrogenase cytochrome b556 subunit [Candidatus Aschnera chinzeii]
MKKINPKNLSLHTIYFPITAILSILHRISGVVMFIIFGILLLLFNISLSSASNFQYIMEIMHLKLIKFVIWNLIVIFVYHFFSGIYHILLDFGIVSKSININLIAAKIVFIFTIIIATIIGIILW